MSVPPFGNGVYHIVFKTSHTCDNGHRLGVLTKNSKEPKTSLIGIESYPLPPNANGEEKDDKWIIYRPDPQNKADTFRIVSFAKGYPLIVGKRGGLRAKAPKPSKPVNTDWKVETDPDRSASSTTPRVRISTEKSEGGNEPVYVVVDPTANPQDWRVVGRSSVQDPPYYLSLESVEMTPNPDSFQEKFFNLSLEDAAREEYDIIICGSGIGGGVLANDLYDTNERRGYPKKILLLEKGGLVFHSHCLNTARPAGLMNDRGQQNDTFFNQFRKDYKFSVPLPQSQWNGGPMYNLGGRSAAWGLFAPRVHDDVLTKQFLPDVAAKLRDEYYDKAERLMLVSLPTTRRAHQHVMDRLTSKCREIDDSGLVYWQWGRIASEFKDDRNFDFAEGAYSTIDKIIEIAMSRPKGRDDTGREILLEHDHFKTALNADVHSLTIDGPIPAPGSGGKGPKVTGVKVQNPEKTKTVEIRLRNPGPDKDQGKVVLCAGSVHSPAILLRTGDSSDKTHIKDHLKLRKALRLTDHTIVFYQCSFRYKNPEKRSEYGAMKLQTYARMGGNKPEHTILVNTSIDASSFLPRGKSPDPNLPKFIMVFMCQQPLIPENTIELDENEEPKVTMRPNDVPESDQTLYMKRFTLATMKAMSSSAGLEFVGFEKMDNDSPAHDDKKHYEQIKLGYLQVGGVAHELGTLPMQGRENGDDYCLTKDLAIRPDICNGAYVCDLSCFPHSPAANPTLTLAALSIRLSRHLCERLHVKAEDPNTVYVVNHSGAKVKAFVSYHQPGSTVLQPAGDAEEIEPGHWASWVRKENVPQVVLVYRKVPGEDRYFDRPLHIDAEPGKVTAIRPPD